MIYMENRPELLYSFFATWDSRATCVCIDASSTSEELEYFIDNSDVVRIFTSNEQLEKVETALSKLKKDVEIINVDKIDFSKKTVVIAAAGPFNTGGYSIVPISAIKTGKGINVVFKVKSPGPKDMVTQAFTHPYVVVSVDAEPDTVVFVEINGDAKSGKLDL